MITFFLGIFALIVLAGTGTFYFSVQNSSGIDKVKIFDNGNVTAAKACICASGSDCKITKGLIANGTSTGKCSQVEVSFQPWENKCLGNVNCSHYNTPNNNQTCPIVYGCTSNSRICQGTTVMCSMINPTVCVSYGCTYGAVFCSGSPSCSTLNQTLCDPLVTINCNWFTGNCTGNPSCGNVPLKSSCETYSKNCFWIDAATDYLKIQNATEDVPAFVQSTVAYIDSNGVLCARNISQNNAMTNICAYPSFNITDSAGTVEACFDKNGDFYARGKIVCNATGV